MKYVHVHTCVSVHAYILLCGRFPSDRAPDDIGFFSFRIKWTFHIHMNIANPSQYWMLKWIFTIQSDQCMVYLYIHTCISIQCTCTCTLS